MLPTGFLAKERAEIFAEIRAAVGGTTEMLESLLIFSRTGARIRRQPELMATLVERATAMVRTHPDAEGVTLIDALRRVRGDGRQQWMENRSSERFQICF